MTEQNDFNGKVTEKIESNNICRKEVDEQRTIIQITEHLWKLGMPAHVLGYQYLREAIVMTLYSPDKICKITKELYPDVAKKYKTTSSKVERAMRHAIEIAWNRGDRDYISKIFGNTISVKKGKPTNSEFIALLSDYMRIHNQA